MPQVQTDGTVTHDARSNSVLVSLNQNPLGTMGGENFTVPSNFQYPPARIYVVNHTRTRKWKRIHIAVSARQGADRALMEDKQFRDLYGNEDMVYKAVSSGRDMNRYKEEVKAVVWKLALPGGKFVPIPPAHEDTPDKLIMVEVPDGAWDLYLGNYERMRGFPGQRPRLADGSRHPEEKFNPKIQGDEQSALALRWRTRHNPVYAYTDDNESTDLKNPYGVLEFVRITSRATAEVVDKDYLSALDLFEN